MDSDRSIEKFDQFVDKRRTRIAVVNYVSAAGTVGYRIKGARRCYESTVETFLKNWTNLKDAIESEKSTESSR
jgi:hypothetical protein